MVKQYGTLYQDTRRALLAQENGQDAGVLARMLICHVSGKSQAQFLAERDLYASEKVVQEVETGLNRLLAGEPIAYLLGQWEFYGLPMKVTPDVLIPRDDTEAVCGLAIGKAMQLRQNPRVLDLCAGSGCIGLAIASKVKDARVTLGEISPEAIRVAKKNIQDNHLAGRVSVVQLDVREAPPRFLGKYDLIVSNPPYVTAAQMEELDPSVRDYEPRLALYGGLDGLDFYRAIVKNYAQLLRPGGSICFEFGMGQEAGVCQILMEHGFELGRLVRDSGERARAVLAHKKDREE